MKIHVAHSPDSDDAFMFYALAEGLIDTEGLEYVHELQDIETLNHRALRGELVRMAFTRVTGSGDGLSEANLAELDRFLHGGPGPGRKEMFGVKLERRGKVAAYGEAA